MWGPTQNGNPVLTDASERQAPRDGEHVTLLNLQERTESGADRIPRELGGAVTQSIID